MFSAIRDRYFVLRMIVRMESSRSSAVRESSCNFRAVQFPDHAVETAHQISQFAFIAGVVKFDRIVAAGDGFHPSGQLVDRLHGAGDDDKADQCSQQDADREKMCSH